MGKYALIMGVIPHITSKSAHILAILGPLTHVIGAFDPTLPLVKGPSPLAIGYYILGLSPSIGYF